MNSQVASETPYLEGPRVLPTKDSNGLRMQALSTFEAWDEIRAPRILLSGGACIDCLIDTCYLG